MHVVVHEERADSRVHAERGGVSEGLLRAPTVLPVKAVMNDGAADGGLGAEMLPRMTIPRTHSYWLAEW